MSVEHRYHQVRSGLEDSLELAEPLDHTDLLLTDHLDRRAEEQRDGQSHRHDHDQYCQIHLTHRSRHFCRSAGERQVSSPCLG
jgi:hypothetical protein